MGPATAAVSSWPCSGFLMPSIERAWPVHSGPPLGVAGANPLTALVGPNGSGKSTVFDVFAFLSDSFSVGLRKTWDKRGRFKEMRSRNAKGPITFELKYREPGYPLIAYHLEIDEDAKGPFVGREWLRWTRKSGKAGRPATY